MNYFGETTNPKDHDPTNYRYLVHAFTIYAILGRKRAGGLGDHPDFFHLCDEPERVSEVSALCMSLISPEKRRTFGSVGLILACPIMNIIAIAPHDIGTQTGVPDDLVKQSMLYPPRSTLLNGTRLLHRTHPKKYNEIVACGNSPKGGDIILQGFFYVYYGQYQPLDPLAASIIRGHSDRLGLPLIPLLQPD